MPRRAGALAQIGLRSLTLLVAVGLLLALGGRYRWRLDLSLGERHSLAPRTEALLAALPAAPRITLFLPDREPERSRAAALFGACRARRPGLSWSFIDPGREPARALAAGVQEPGEVLIEVGGESARLRAERSETGDYRLDEAAFARALAGFLREARGGLRVAVAQAPGLRTLGLAGQDAGPESLSGLVTELEGEDWQVVPWWALSEPPPAPGEAVLLLPGPHRRLPPALLAQLERFLAGGGALCLLIDPAAEMADSSGDAGLGPLLAARGIGLGAGFVVDFSEENIALERGFEVPVATRYAAHPATRSFLTHPEPSCFPLARALDLVTEAEGEGAGAPRPLLISSDRSFEERGPFDGSAHLDEATDRRGPFVLAAASDSSAQGGGPLLVVGDSHFVSAAHLDWYGNGRLLLGGLAWLAQDRLGPGAAPPPARLLPITPAGRRLYVGLSLLALPLLVFSAWPLRLWRDRRRARARGGKS